jgi:Mg-chelatase subunit ChlD
MAPEQVQGNRTLDGRVDVYALGIVLFEALTGQTPFHGDTPMGVAIAHINEPVPSVLSRLPSAPPAFEPVIRKALEKDPNRRFQTAAELSQAIEGAAAGRGTVVEGTPSTYVEAPGATYVEPAGGQPAPKAAQTFNPPSLPVKKRSPFPAWLIGVAVLGLCACIGVVGAFAFDLIPNPLAGTAPSATPPAVSVEETATPTIEPTATEAASPTVQPTAFIPEGLASTYIEYILDASGSMLQAMDGTTRLQIAQEVLTKRLDNLPDGTQVGLRVYGHRVPYQGREDESCADIELAVPIRADGAVDIITWLPGMQAQGMTPMSESIRQAANDFTFDGQRRNFIVLISDGMETCGDDPAEVVEFLREIGVDFSIHVIGLDVDPGTAAQLSGIADAGGGVYYDARSRADLDAALGNINGDILADSDSPPASPTPEPSLTPIPEPNAVITDEGEVTASSTYSSEFAKGLAVDGNPATSWFSAGPGAGGITMFTWTGVQDDFIGSIGIVSNRSHADPVVRTGYGFGAVTVQVLDAAGIVVFEEVVDLAGTPDPDVLVTPNVVGRCVVLIFSGSEALDCGGFAELVISAVR